MNGLADDVPLQTDTVPLRVDESGIVRVGESRVSLDELLDEYERGLSPEEMVQAHEALDLHDVYAVLAYYLRHTDEVHEFLNRRREEAQNPQLRFETGSPESNDSKPRHASGKTEPPPSA